MHRKVSIIGGGGVRTPLLIHGLLQAQSLLGIAELQLFDVDSRRAQTYGFPGTGNRAETWRDVCD